MKLLYKTIANKKMEVDKDCIVFAVNGNLKGIFTWEEIADILSEKVSEGAKNAK